MIHVIKRFPKMVNHTGFKRIYITTTQTYNNNNNNNNKNNNNNNDNIYTYYIYTYIIYIYIFFSMVTWGSPEISIPSDVIVLPQALPAPPAMRPQLRPGQTSQQGPEELGGQVLGDPAMAVAAMGPCLNHGKYGEKPWKSVAKWDPKLA